MKSVLVPALLSCLLAVSPAVVIAQASDIRVEQVRFAKGASSATIEASITGYETVDYVLGAGAGQHMNVSMATDNTANYFNIIAPGEADVAMFNGSMGENQFEGILPKNGDYKVRVYLMRSAARRSEVAHYRLEMIITNAELPPASAAPSSAERAGKGDFDATGFVPCARHLGQPTTSCALGVAREGGGTATVVVTHPDGFRRALFFVEGKFLSADTSQSDGYPEYSATKESDLNFIRVGPERYEIPDAVTFGG